MKGQIGPRALIARLKRNLGPYSEQLPELPLLIYRIIQRNDHNNHHINAQLAELASLRSDIRNRYKRIRLLFTSMLLAWIALVLYCQNHP